MNGGVIEVVVNNNKKPHNLLLVDLPHPQEILLLLWPQLH